MHIRFSTYKVFQELVNLSIEATSVFGHPSFSLLIKETAYNGILSFKNINKW
ncbi:hypothetical protein SAMN04489723_101349 [Algoriphagus aquimarinus]|uniref:Uncharacterized protein n=1 Tax=Algoriphagus aquimarinus TaxID=237018 RepID=A0A1I0VS37_9BACT|nr:hypothetical protein SAMN04489723_101349 [Algoriphagus aquimarinus]